MTRRSSGNNLALKRLDYSMLPGLYNNFGDKLRGVIDANEHWILSRVIQSLFRIPPITMFYLFSSTLIALTSLIINDNYPFEFLLFDYNRIINGEIWRLFTPYFLFGQLWLSHLLMCQSIAVYMSSVEIAYCTQPDKFLEMLIYGMITLSLYGVIDYKIYGDYKVYESLSYHLHTFILYYWSRLNEGTLVNCFDVFSIPAEYIPYFFMLQNHLLYKDAARGDFAAIVLAYLYFYLLSHKNTLYPFKIPFQSTLVKGIYKKFTNELSF